MMRNAKYVVIFVLLMLVYAGESLLNGSMLSPEQSAYIAVAAHKLADENNVSPDLYLDINKQLLVASGDHVTQTEWGVRLPSPEVSLRLAEELLELTPVMGRVGIRMTIDDDRGCWALPLALEHDEKGRARYPKIYDSSRRQPVVAHRYLWRQFIDPAIPTNIYLDHLCRAHACCNPAHLEPVSSSHNTKRGNNARHILSGQDVLFHTD